MEVSFALEDVGEQWAAPLPLHGVQGGREYAVGEILFSSLLRFSLMRDLEVPPVGNIILVVAALPTKNTHASFHACKNPEKGTKR
jgi:hypothetical protein